MGNPITDFTTKVGSVIGDAAADSGQSWNPINADTSFYAAYNNSLNQLQRKWSLEDTADQRKYEEDMYNRYNSPAAMARQFRDAGFSQYAAFDKSVGFTSPTSMNNSDTSSFASSGLSAMTASRQNSLQARALKQQRMFGLADSLMSGAKAALSVQEQKEDVRSKKLNNDALENVLAGSDTGNQSEYASPIGQSLSRVFYEKHGRYPNALEFKLLTSAFNPEGENMYSFYGPSDTRVDVSPENQNYLRQYAKDSDVPLFIFKNLKNSLQEEYNRGSLSLKDFEVSKNLLYSNEDYWTHLIGARQWNAANNYNAAKLTSRDLDIHGSQQEWLKGTLDYFKTMDVIDRLTNSIGNILGNGSSALDLYNQMKPWETFTTQISDPTTGVRKTWKRYSRSR